MTRLLKITELLYFKGYFDNKKILIESTDNKEDKADLNIIISIAF